MQKLWLIFLNMIQLMESLDAEVKVGNNSIIVDDKEIKTFSVRRTGFVALERLRH